jgi:hypothetical protein
VVDEVLHDRRLVRKDRAVQRRAAAPARIADAEVEQIRDVVRIDSVERKREVPRSRGREHRPESATSSSEMIRRAA